MKVNRRKLALVSVAPIFAAISIYTDAWGQLDIGRAFSIGQLAYAEKTYAASKGTTAAEIRAIERASWEKNYPKCREEHGWKPGNYISAALDPCEFYPAAIAVPKDDVPTFIAGTINAVLAFFPLMLILALSIGISIVCVFGMPALSRWFTRWIQT